MPRIAIRPCPEEARRTLAAAGLEAPFDRLYAARGITRIEETAHRFARLAPPEALRGIDTAARLLADAIEARRRILIVADYDADGATACAVGVAGLRQMGAEVDYLVPDRLAHGYGLSPAVVELAAARAPDLIVTVDNGIAAIDGVAAANARGIPVLVTDHHLPGEHLPEAACIVNPNQPGCPFPSKHLAGVGVMFYVLLALRAELRRRGRFADGGEPDLRGLLDRVALGTVADVVRLDETNRILVAQGLARIRTGRASPGVEALFRIAGRDPARATAGDLGFAIGPRLNAAGRLDSMTTGIDCLLAGEASTALTLAQRLDALNQERRAVEADMLDAALARLDGFDVDARFTLVAAEPGWHPGVIGILASRLKDRYHRPTLVFAPAEDGTLKGSGRSIPGLHLRDALDLVDRRVPGCILKFGGHAMAAGLTLAAGTLSRFAAGFESVVRELLDPAALEGTLETDGELAPAHHTVALAERLDAAVWGQGFPPPLFVGEFEVTAQRIVGEKHLKLAVRLDGHGFDAMWFFHAEPLPPRVIAAYSLMADTFQGQSRLTLKFQHVEAAG